MPFASEHISQESNFNSVDEGDATLTAAYFHPVMSHPFNKVYQSNP